MRKKDGFFIVEKKGRPVFEGFQGIIVYIVSEEGILDMAEGFYEDGEYVILKHLSYIVVLDTYDKKQRIKKLKDIVYDIMMEYHYDHLLRIAITEEVAKWLEI